MLAHVEGSGKPPLTWPVASSQARHELPAPDPINGRDLGPVLLGLLPFTVGRLGQLFQEGLGLLKGGSVEAFGEPIVNGAE